ncbi:hypothetical protein MPH_06676 [Macrophomina phaseolina MS6]|uniref:Uncharacterized protein n=1 Tax=Macrophomina phaseolina (strain MS6) TaxID=1126212 RepID=K2SH03_MACPH|nr:hypothetical protein MPH_06676 [Macrophomina phaseolina MS6]
MELRLRACTVEVPESLFLALNEKERGCEAILGLDEIFWRFLSGKGHGQKGPDLLTDVPSLAARDNAQAFTLRKFCERNGDGPPLLQTWHPLIHTAQLTDIRLPQPSSRQREHGSHKVTKFRLQSLSAKVPVTSDHLWIYTISFVSQNTETGNLIHRMSDCARMSRQKAPGIRRELFCR